MGARQREPHTALSWVFGEWGENVGTRILTKDPACTCFQVMPRLPESKARKAGQVDRDREICTYWLLALEKPLDAVSRSLGWGGQRPLIAMFFSSTPSAGKMWYCAGCEGSFKRASPPNTPSVLTRLRKRKLANEHNKILISKDQIVQQMVICAATSGFCFSLNTS